MMKDILQKYDTFGIVLSHGYSLNTEKLEGNDAEYYNVLKKLSKEQKLNIKMISILSVVNQQAKGYSNEDRERFCESSVYPVSDEEIAYVLEEGENLKHIIEENIHFHYLKVEIWDHSYTSQESSYTEKDYDKSNENCIYLNRAIHYTKRSERYTS